MSISIPTDEQLFFVLVQPTRQKIIKLLEKSKEPLYIKQIAKKIKESERNTSFHLAELSMFGFVDGEYREIKPPKHGTLGRAGKFYFVTPKVNQVKKKLIRSLEQ